MPQPDIMAYSRWNFVARNVETKIIVYPHPLPVTYAVTYVTLAFHMARKFAWKY